MFQGTPKRLQRWLLGGGILGVSAGVWCLVPVMWRVETAVSESDSLRPAGGIPGVAALRNVEAKHGLPPDDTAAKISADLMLALGSADAARWELRMGEALTRVPSGSIGAVLAQLWQEGNPGRETRELISRLVRRWAQEDVHAAAEWVRQAAPGPLREVAFDQVAVAWVEQDLWGAIDWAGSAAGDIDGERISRQVAYEVSRTEPLEALELAVHLSPDRNRDQLIQHACMGWASRDGAAAAQWAVRIEDKMLRETALAAVATAWAEQNPYDAALLVSEEMKPGRLQEGAVTAIVQRWAQQDSPSAAEWVSQFEDSALKTSAMNALLEIWGKQDRPAMEAWRSGEMSAPASGGKDAGHG